MLNIKVGEPNEFWSIDLTGPHVTSRHASQKLGGTDGRTRSHRQRRAPVRLLVTGAVR